MENCLTVIVDRLAGGQEGAKEIRSIAHQLEEALFNMADEKQEGEHQTYTV